MLRSPHTKEGETPRTVGINLVLNLADIFLAGVLAHGAKHGAQVANADVAVAALVKERKGLPKLCQTPQRSVLPLLPFSLSVRNRRSPVYRQSSQR